MARPGGEPCRRGRACLVALAMLAPALPASAQAPAAAGNFSASLTAGITRPSASVFREVYGSPIVPVAGQVGWRFGRSGLGVFAGLRWVSSTGEAIVEGASRAGGERVEFSMTSWRVGPSWSVRRGPWALAAGAGLAFGSYREEWAAAGLRVEDSGAGAVFQGSVERRIGGRLSALLRVEHLVFDVDPPEGTGLGRVALGGTDLAAGIAISF